MRTSSLGGGSLFIDTMPSTFILYITLIFLGASLIYKFIKTNHSRGLTNSTKWFIAPIVIGVLSLILGYMVSLDALKHTHGTEKTTATIIQRESERRIGSTKHHRYNYIYTIEYVDNDVTKKAELIGTSNYILDAGDKIEIYYIPDDIEEKNGHKIIAVEVEKSIGNKYIIAGMIYCVLGLTLIILVKSKEKIIDTGIPTSAKVIQIAPVYSKSAGKKKGYMLICQGRNPATQMLVNFSTMGSYNDFLHLEEGSSLTVIVSRNDPKLYVISI